MSTLAPSRPRTRRPRLATTITAILAFLGITAVGGGAEMLLYPAGNAFLPARWLDDIPLVDSWLVPGLVLGLGFGVGSLLTAFGVLRRPRWRPAAGVERLTGQHWSWSATVVLGVAMIAWIALEAAYLPARSWLEVVYGLTGIALAALPWFPAVRRYLAA
jgi:hypothetical protein